MELHLSAEERELLAEVLEERHRELLRQVFKTDRHDLKQALKHKEEVLEKLLDKVGIPVGA